MKKASVIGPMLLILVGLVFLVHNVWPEVALGDLISSYWPFVLVAWGGLRLLEILAWASMGRALPRTGISGGEWFGVFALCLVGAGMHTARHYSSWLPTGRSLRGVMMNMGEPFDFTVEPVSKTAEKAPRLVIESFRGSARITGVDGNKVTVSGRKTIRAFQQSEADQANAATPVDLVSQGDQMIVRTNQDHVNDNLRVSSELEIQVPKGASVEAHGRYGDFDIRDIGGSIEIVSDNAGVRIDNAGGDVRIDLRKSDIVRATGVKGLLELKGHGQDVELQNINGLATIEGEFLGQIQLKNLAQPLRFESSRTTLECEKVPGQLHMGPGEFTANNLIGPIRLKGRSRDVQITEFTQSLELTLDRGDIELRPMRSPMPKLDVKTKSGDIDLVIPSAARFELHMSTARGEVHDEYGSPLSADNSKRRGSITGSVGDGPVLRLETDHGSITARKGGGEELKVEQQ